ncbi:UDP-N-acetylglucosamine 1-carboxyvinyltransferase [Gluconobacter thailandicus F149-1 = NBRC 100600]|uniref:UDP-N-acetylglucosamine 1-carboxyvinyltransferase n=1 Tax=Gluconobacter thailandicus NBRC 3257 TaxID=1381097 RepID=A0ABQ0IVC1_GLUTH|nr:UDP-N-acetylglucosamine 1-carboxyvinyltransferase [Gluconobacter thailandicus]KXV52060.1 UDP-N-acetylglucosamine 1-carboxyvinyltransferase [Gluconobacter thailandicus]GAC86569.1 UDP-N-acetylglucosamine 1-carboxyvinyltransferase [Gluconobacter thailandicus NBRC 3255]GAD26130.1 UDP-N-acetylglucosamine 1-carboxyvinyltransferase [Gluconobacter thailandicus NBRC 3257]GAN93110.1 UDP-N-acetylglucosamine 1-carboxyvinyltransferase [Gluconobacter thailandicus F149-1 = NBRC 100600]GBR59863.1 UDP-N-ace
MDRFIIRGGRRLVGEIEIGGAKNSGLKLMVAGLLTAERLVLSNVPQIADIKTMRNLLTRLGIAVDDAGPRTLSIGGEIASVEAPYDVVSKMRASILVLGPLLARAREAKVSLPGGCAIGTRPVDMHLKGLEALGAEIRLENGYINARAPNGLKGDRIVLPFASVGATENLLMASTLAKGRTEIMNAAREPEITDLVNCLNAMGAKITGAGSGTLIIEGVEALHGAEYAVMPDRIECGTYACAAGITGGDLLLVGGCADDLGAVVRTLEETGVEVTEEARGLRVRRTGRLQGVDIMTEPYPGFPTDMQAQFMAMLSVAEGASMITETIFENRFMHVPELNRMGARINPHGRSAIIRGVEKLSGAPVMATDLRASFSLILAGLAAEGETQLSRIYHLDRGYEGVDRKLAACGADIARVSD